MENLEDTWNKYHSSFQDFESYNHLQILLYLPFVQSHHLDDDLKYLKMALENANKHTENPGYNHAFADLFASIYEKYEYDFNNLTNFESYRQLALDKVELAIDQEETTAVYYCTKARIISILGRYNEAESLFLTAISKEIVNRTDYSLRIGKFQYYKLLNQTRKQISEATQRTYELKENIEQTKKEFEQSRISNIEFVGFFSGIVSFVIGSLNIAEGHTACEAGLLVLTLMGCLTGALSAFSMLLHIWNNDTKTNRRVAKKYILVIICSLVLTIASILAINFFCP